MSELLINQTEFNSPKREVLLQTIKEVDFSNEKSYERLFEIVPELRNLDFSTNHPVHPFNVLEHSVRSAQKATSDTVMMALLFHDFGKSLPECQKWVENTINPNAPLVLKSPDHEIYGVEPVDAIIRGNGLALNPAELDLILGIVRYHDSWGHTFYRDFDDMVKTFNPETVEYLFEAQRLDLSTHSAEYAGKNLENISLSQNRIKEVILIFHN